MTTKTTRLSDKAIAALPKPEGGRKYAIHYDSDLPGFGVRIMANGKAAFILNYRVDGRERRLTIGSTAEWSTGAARKRAAELRQAIRTGRDPLGERESSRAAATVNNLLDRYLAEHVRPKNRPTSAENTERLVDRLIRPALGRLKVAAVRFSDIDGLHRRVSTKSGPFMANRTLAALSKAFSLAIRWQMRADNPCKGVERNPEPPRRRYLSDDEIARLSRALADWEDMGRGESDPWRAQTAAIVKLLLLTGARCGETLSATWGQFDLKLGIWTKPSASTKQKAEHRVPLSRAAIDLLSALPRTSAYVFPGRAGAAHQQRLNRAWETIRTTAGIPDVRIHDLRHSFASQLVGAGLSLRVVGEMLGHTQAATTQRYAHVADDPLRHAAERAAELLGAASKRPMAEVVSIRGGRP
ncbi:MAG: tyrosine-type recombinase/integrase [Porticoccaceae bacterium]